jgi:hypothetical protein
MEKFSVTGILSFDGAPWLRWMRGNAGAQLGTVPAETGGWPWMAINDRRGQGMPAPQTARVRSSAPPSFASCATNGSALPAYGLSVAENVFLLIVLPCSQFSRSSGAASAGAPTGLIA